MITTVIDQLYSITVRGLTTVEIIELVLFIKADDLAAPPQIKVFMHDVVVRELDFDEMMAISREADNHIRARVRDIYNKGTT